MFERFTEDAREAVVLAKEEADALGHDAIGTQHLVLALIRVAPGLLSPALTREAVIAQTPPQPGARRVDADALATIGIDLEQVRRCVEETFGPGALLRTRAGCRAFARPFTPQAKKALELASQEARKLGDRVIEPRHLLAGLAAEGSAPTAAP